MNEEREGGGDREGGRDENKTALLSLSERNVLMFPPLRWLRARKECVENVG